MNNPHDSATGGTAQSRATRAARPPHQPFSLLLQLANDPIQLELFSPEASLAGWLAAERALAIAQARHGVILPEDAEAIAQAAQLERINADAVWASARNVGYPIIGLVQEICKTLPRRAAGRVHFGATTQDIMDTGFALQLVRSSVAFDRGLANLGNALTEKALAHADTIMAARTHAQQAVPTTFGATLASLLSQLSRHRTRLAELMSRLGTISLFGAGGTSAALGPSSRLVRATAADLLGLRTSNTPWHVERDTIAEFGWLAATIAATCAKFARNIIDLSRTEVAEVFEPFASHRGASSTMPQKVNPISSEIIIGLAGSAGALAAALPRIQEAGHERSAGEWQIEWHVIPQLAVLAGSALREATIIAEGMRVDSARMRANLQQDSGLIMAEAWMMQLAQTIGHDRAHDVVYAAATRARKDRISIGDAVSLVLTHGDLDEFTAAFNVEPEQYLGEASRTAREEAGRWQSVTPLSPHEPVARLAQELCV